MLVILAHEMLSQKNGTIDPSLDPPVAERNGLYTIGTNGFRSFCSLVDKPRHRRRVRKEDPVTPKIRKHDPAAKR